MLTPTWNIDIQYDNDPVIEINVNPVDSFSHMKLIAKSL